MNSNEAGCRTSESASECANFYRIVVVFVPGSCLVIATFVILAMILRESCCSPLRQDNLLGSYALLSDRFVIWVNSVSSLLQVSFCS